MSSKRVATSDLNHDNWNEEEEPEAPGVFKKASETELQKRVIISAKRRIAPSSGKSDEPDASKAQSVFGGFAGFGKTSTFGSSTNASPFSFLSNKGSADKVEEKPTAAGSVHSGLADLNKAFLKWVQSCIDKNPDCILLPVFKDYEKYVQELKKDKTPVSSAPIPTFGDAAASSTLATTTSSSSITSSVFGSIPAFSFGTSTGFPAPTSSSLFANVAKPATTTNGDDADNDDEDAPPKVEFTPVVEEDSVYSKRCKVFVKKDGNFSDRGVGTLFVKKVQVADKDKYQLIVRADTSLGNLLLNVLLAEAIPTQRMGKNNVMLVCSPNSGDPVSPVLLRVKTENEADDLLKEIEKYKK